MRFARKHRIYPNKYCQKQLLKQDRCNRLVWNETLAYAKSVLYQTSKYEMSAYLANVLKKKFPFLYEVSAQALQQVTRDLDRTITAYRRPRNPIAEPRFKRKSWKKSMRFSQHVKVDSEQQLLYLPRLMDHPIPIVLERELPNYGMVTISQSPDGRWYACFFIQQTVKDPTLYKDSKHLGIDLGLTNFAAFSTGEIVKAPKFFRETEKKLAKLNKILARKTIGSRRWIKNRLRLSRTHSKVFRSRHDWIHKLSHRIANDDSVEAVAVETLKIQEMIEKGRLSKSISDVSWKSFIIYLEYKLVLRGKILTFSDWKFPSTQLCSNCRQKTGPKYNLDARDWTCTSCGAKHNRDINAAKNIAYDADLRLVA